MSIHSLLTFLSVVYIVLSLICENHVTESIKDLYDSIQNCILSLSVIIINQDLFLWFDKHWEIMFHLLNNILIDNVFITINWFKENDYYIKWNSTECFREFKLMINYKKTNVNIFKFVFVDNMFFSIVVSQFNNHNDNQHQLLLILFSMLIKFFKFLKNLLQSHKFCNVKNWLIIHRLFEWLLLLLLL
jgi:hypothetical protein